MIDREKVLTWLTICGKNRDCSGCCPYLGELCGEDEMSRCREDLMADALELLKEQEARLLTQHEIIGYNGYIWKEYKEVSTMAVSEIKMGLERIPYDGEYKVKNMNWATYKKLWRCWTAKPTEEQRQAVKWE